MATLITLPSKPHAEDTSEREKWEQENDSTHFKVALHEYGVSSLAEIISTIEQYYRESFQASTLVTELINMQFSTTELGMIELEHKITISEPFKKNFDPMIMIKCRQIISVLDQYFMLKGIGDSQYFLGVHELGEDEYVEKVPYIEIRVPVDGVDELLCIWKEAIDFLKEVYPEEDLGNVDIFFTRK